MLFLHAVALVPMDMNLGIIFVVLLLYISNCNYCCI